MLKRILVHSVYHRGEFCGKKGKIQTGKNSERKKLQLEKQTERRY